MARKKEKAISLPAHLEGQEARRSLPWPSPTPLPSFPTENAWLMLKQILARLDSIERRLENIEKILVGVEKRKL